MLEHGTTEARAFLLQLKDAEVTPWRCSAGRQAPCRAFRSRYQRWRDGWKARAAPIRHGRLLLRVPCWGAATDVFPQFSQAARCGTTLARIGFRATPESSNAWQGSKSLCWLSRPATRRS